MKYKNILIAIFLCSVFVVGIQMIDHVDAAKYTKFKEEKIKIETTNESLIKPVVQLQSYKKGKDNYLLKVNVYKKKNNKKMTLGTTTVYKKNKQIYLVGKIMGSGTTKESFPAVFSTKKAYNLIYKEFKRSFVSF